MKYVTSLLLLVILVGQAKAQFVIIARVTSEGKGVPHASMSIPAKQRGTLSDSAGYIQMELEAGAYNINVTATGFLPVKMKLQVPEDTGHLVSIEMHAAQTDLSEIVVTGTLKEMSRLESPVPVEVYTPKMFQKNPVPSLFEALNMVNGVKPQLNCNVCNTGDIHINGMEGPYTMILIDGMPIVSALSTVYGLNGIPNSLVERIEVVKGPGSSLYGSEAMGGIINVITKNPLKAPLVSADIFATSWGEYSADASVKWKAGKAHSLLGINYFNYNRPLDKNADGFTDVTIQKRISVFNKWSFDRKDNKLASLAARYVYEDRWGGQMNWNKNFRGSDSIYGESIYTNRWEMIGMYQLPVKERIFTQFSYNYHQQNSWYGLTPYMAKQQILFGQLYWDKQVHKKHNLLVGASYRITYYDDNTPGTASPDGLKNAPAHTPLPGIFVQYEWQIDEKNKLLAGYRYDYDKHHGGVHSPRLAYKWSPGKNTFRASVGTGYRVVNLFTEDHAALTGAREVVITEALLPERSYNANVNFVRKFIMDDAFIGLDVTGFYSWFTNKIVGDFDTDPNKIIYDNLKGHAISRGISVNLDMNFAFPLKVLAGITYMDVYQVEDKQGLGVMEKSVQLNAPNWSGTWAVSYTLPRNWTVDFTGKWDGPMRLPVLPNDYRPEYSPWFAIANLQLTKKFDKGFEIYGGVKNLFNFVPADPIMRPFDPFDKKADDPVNNPYGYSFDPSYNYSPMQGIRGFLGVRFVLQ